jgi:hypothetical protein
MVGNARAVKHGATAVLALAPRSAQIAEGLRPLVPLCSEADEPAIRVLAGVLARIETANVFLDEHGLFRPGKDKQLQPVAERIASWENSAARMMDQLGLTPTSRAKLGVDLTRQRDAIAEAIAQQREAREREEAQSV